MKYIFWMVLLGFSLSSCQFFETEKISSETFYEQEKAQIDWKDIDRYPTFPGCASHTEKGDQKNCFESTVREHLNRSIQHRNLETTHELHDTLWVRFEISKEGKLFLSEAIEMDSLTNVSLPFLSQWITESMDSLPNPMPAYKRGIPVRSHFSIPLVLATAD